MRALRGVGSVAGLALGLLLSVNPAFAMSAADARLWREDLHFMAAEMEKTHKNLFHTIPRDQFHAMVGALDRKIPKLERHEVLVEMMAIVAAVGDGHTNIYPTRDAKIGFRELPVSFTFFEGDLRVRAATLEHAALLGAKVARIGETGIEGAVLEALKLVGRDNDHGARYWIQYLLAMPEVLHALRLVPTPDEVPLTLETEAGPIQMTLQPHGPAPIMSGDIATLFNRRDGWVDLRDLSTAPTPLWLRDTRRTFGFEHVGPVLYVQINSILDSPTEKLAQFAERLRTEIATTRPEKVAIDLRLNRGGNGMLVTPLIRALIQSEAIDRPGRLFGIIGPATFSAAQMFIDELDTYTEMLFVGEASGSKGNAYGDSRRITLPNSGITVRASIYYWQYWHPMDKRVATDPDIAAPLSFADYRKNIDPALEAIRTYDVSRPKP